MQLGLGGPTKMDAQTMAVALTVYFNRITPTFSRLMKKVGIRVLKRTALCALRRTAATMAARSGDQFTVQKLLGHVDLTMATRYVQDVSEQTDRVIESSRKYVLQE